MFNLKQNCIGAALSYKAYVDDNSVPVHASGAYKSIWWKDAQVMSDLIYALRDW